jgi:hypothetical protein
MLVERGVILGAAIKEAMARQRGLVAPAAAA